MSKFIICLMSAACFLFMPFGSDIMGKDGEKLKAGDEVKTEFFSLTIPEGWIMPGPVRSQPNGGVSAVFMPQDGNPVLTLNVMPGAIDIPDYVAKMSEDMKKQGLEAGPLTEKNGLATVAIKGPANGEGWFGTNGEISAVTMLFGNDMARANQILATLKPVAKGLFPLKVD